MIMLMIMIIILLIIIIIRCPAEFAGILEAVFLFFSSFVVYVCLVWILSFSFKQFVFIIIVCFIVSVHIIECSFLDNFFFPGHIFVTPKQFSYIYIYIYIYSECVCLCTYKYYLYLGVLRIS